jgi:hypothetical protein
MRSFLVIPASLAALVFAALPVVAAFNDDTVVRAGTPEAATMISRLQQARQVDRMDARGFMGGVNRDAGLFYYRKSQEVEALLKRLRQGEPVPISDIQRALDNRDVVRYGGGF